MKRPIVIVIWSVALMIEETTQLVWLLVRKPHVIRGVNAGAYYVFSSLPGLAFTVANICLATALFGLSRWALVLLLAEMAFGAFIIALHWPHLPLLSYVQVIVVLAFAATAIPCWNKMNWRPFGSFRRGGFESGQNAHS